LLLLIALAMLIPLTSYDISIQRRDSEKQATPQAYPFGIQLEPIIPEAHALDIVSDDFGSGLSGWTYGAIPGYSQCGGYTLTRDTGTGNPAPSAFVYGDSYNCYAGMKKTVSLTGWTYPNQLMLSFNWRAASGYYYSTVTNMFIYIYDGSTYLYGATLVYGGTYDTGWRTWGPTNIAGSVGSRSSITIYFFLVDGWSANWSQRNWADNVRLYYTPSTASITITSNPAGSGYVAVDGAAISTPQTFTWTVGSTHTIAATSPISCGSGCQYVWTSWSDGGGQSHQITVPGSAATYTANFKTQYYLTVNSAHGSPTGAGWYDSGSTASFSVTSPVSGGTGIQYVCTGYSGDASGSGTTGSIVMSGAKTVTFSWKTQYQLTVAVSPSGGGTTIPSVGSYWYDSGSKVTISATAVSGYRFQLWTGSGAGSYTGPSSSAQITMNGPITETAIFIHVVTITFQTGGMSGDASGTVITIDGVDYPFLQLPKIFIWDAGSTHTIAATSPVNCGSGCQYVWASWSDGGAQSHTYTTPSSAQTVTATYTKQYQVTFAVSGISSDATGTVVTVNGAAKTLSQLPYTAWYDSGATVTYSFASPVSASLGKQYAWLSTSGLGQIARSGMFTASASGTVTATYRTQFELTIQVDPPGTGTANPAAGTYWYNAGEAVQLSAAGSGSYVFTSWTGTGTGSYRGTDNPATITMDAPITETANFAQLATMIVSYEILDGGSPTPPTFNYVLGGVSKTYTLNETPTPIQADPSSAWSVTPNPLGGSSLTERWYSNQTLSGTASSTTLVFKFQHEYKFTIQVNNPQYGTTAPIPADYWQRPQQSIQVTATPAGNCRFDHWELDGQNAGTSTQYTVTMDAPHTLQAVFMMNSHQVTITATGVGPDAVSTIVTVDGVTYDPTRLPLTLYWEDGSIHTVEAAQSVSTSVSGKCYNWNQWSDGRTDRILQVTATSTLTLTASFKTQYLLSAYSIPTGAETTKNPDSTTGFYDPGTTVQLTASNDYGGLAFVRWLLNGEPQPQGQTSLTVTMSEPSVAIVMYEMKQQQSITVPAYDAVFTSLASLLILAAVLIATRRRH